MLYILTRGLNLLRGGDKFRPFLCQKMNTSIDNLEIFKEKY